MGDEKWRELELGDGTGLSQEEIEEGWHFCPEWDYMLIGPGMTLEMSCCNCKFPEPINGTSHAPESE